MINYESICEKAKYAVNTEGHGRRVVANMLKIDFGLIGTDYQIKTIVRAARFVPTDTKRERDLKDVLIIKMLRAMNGDHAYKMKGDPFKPKSQVGIPESAPENIETRDGTLITGSELDLEEQLRKRYDIQDPNWIPVSVWGDMKNPMVKWERKRVPHDVNNYVERIMFDDLPHSIDLPIENRTSRIAVLSIRDAHFGLLTEHPDPYDKYDLVEATNATVAAGDHLMATAVSNGVDVLVIPIGSDLLHVDGSQNTTTKGTKQDTNGFWWEAFDAAINSVNRLISAATQHFKKTILVIEPGNHDSSLARAVGIAMKSAWGNQDKVSILDNPSTLKRITFGNTHLFMHHGNSIKPNLLQALIYARHPEVITAGSYVEVLCGHYHQRSSKQLREAGDYFEFGGMTIRITPALCPSSNWSESQGYVSSPGAQLTIYDELGFISLHEWRPNRTSVGNNINRMSVKNNIDS